MTQNKKKLAPALSDQNQEHCWFWTLTQAEPSLGFLCSHLDSSFWSCRLRRSGLGSDLASPAPHDVLHERGQPLAHGAAAAQPAALQEEEEAPDHLHRRAARGSGGSVPGDQVPGCGHEGAAGQEGPPEGGESGGQNRVSQQFS